MLCKTRRFYILLGCLLGLMAVGCQKQVTKPPAAPLKIATVQAASQEITDYDESEPASRATSSRSISSTVSGSKKTICSSRSSRMFTKLPTSRRWRRST
ncbi:MAG: hypothetical protein NT168_01365 [Planctomycetota bacterium]|nr:hypothetical protein [Planctomycetota bacterium]